MMKIAFAVAAAAAVLAPAPLLVGSIPAEAQDLKMAQVDVQIGRDRYDRYDRDRRRDATVGIGGAFKLSMGCYHFATQLDGTRWNGLVRRRGHERVLGPKTLTRWHAIKRASMAKAELQNRCSTAELTRQINGLQDRS